VVDPSRRLFIKVIGWGVTAPQPATGNYVDKQQQFQSQSEEVVNVSECLLLSTFPGSNLLQDLAEDGVHLAREDAENLKVIQVPLLFSVDSN